MASLSRTASLESATSNQRSQSGSVNGDTQDLAAEDISGPPSPSSVTKSPQPLAATGRVPSHSLLSAPPNAAVPSRKSRFADVGTSGGTTGRASISMPPPAAKPSSIYRPSAVRRPTATQTAMDAKDGPGSLDGTVEEKALGDADGLDELEKTSSSTSVPLPEPQSPSGMSDFGLRLPPSTSNKPGDRLSFSSLYSLGSVIYNGATGITSAPQSTSSSTAGSVKSLEHSTPTATPMSPSLGSSKGDAASSVTTATDPVSVIANFQPSHQGWRLIGIPLLHLYEVDPF